MNTGIRGFGPNRKYGLYRRLCLCFVVFGLLSVGCHKKDGSGRMVCPPCPLIAERLNFRVVDKQTGQDYFFSNPPKYPIADLHVTTPGLGGDVLFYTDSADHFFTLYTTWNTPTIYYVQIQGLMADTLTFDNLPLNITGTNAEQSCCTPTVVIGNLKLDGAAVPGTVSDTSIVVIRK